MEKPICKIMSSRLQKLKLKLLKSKIEIKYRLRKYMVMTDLLSRINYNKTESNVEIEYKNNQNEDGEN